MFPVKEQKIFIGGSDYEFSKQVNAIGEQSL